MEKSIKLLETKMNTILDKMKNRHANWRREFEKLHKDRALADNPFMSILLSFDQESKAINDSSLQEQL